MSDEDGRWFYCPRCELRIGEIEPDGALLMYPGVHICDADFVCKCGNALYWHAHEMAMGRLIDRVLRMRSTIGSPCGLLT